MFMCKYELYLKHPTQCKDSFRVLLTCLAPIRESSSPQIRPGIQHNSPFTACEMAISLANCPRRRQSRKNSHTSPPDHSPRWILQLGIPHTREKEKGKEAFKRHSIQLENREEEKLHVDWVITPQLGTEEHFPGDWQLAILIWPEGLPPERPLGHFSESQKYQWKKCSIRWLREGSWQYLREPRTVLFIWEDLDHFSRRCLIWYLAS